MSHMFRFPCHTSLYESTNQASWYEYHPSSPSGLTRPDEGGYSYQRAIEYNQAGSLYALRSFHIYPIFRSLLGYLADPEARPRGNTRSLHGRVSSCCLTVLLNASEALRKGSEVQVATFAGDDPTSNLTAGVTCPQELRATLAHAQASDRRALRGAKAQLGALDQLPRRLQSTPNRHDGLRVG
eukprot:scaffold92283_cov75-Phaeocystis_antarctica.AAC.9